MTGCFTWCSLRPERERGRDAGLSCWSGQEGVALLLALMLLVILSLLAFGLVTRSLVAGRVAGLERFPTMTFYAADAGIAGAKARLRVGMTDAFDFGVRDRRGPGAAETGLPISVEVSRLMVSGPPRVVVGSQIGGGQGSDAQSLCVLVYRGESRAAHGLTSSNRKVSMTLSIGPVPIERVLSRESLPGEGGG